MDIQRVVDSYAGLQPFVNASKELRDAAYKGDLSEIKKLCRKGDYSRSLDIPYVEGVYRSEVCYTDFSSDGCYEGNPYTKNCCINRSWRYCSDYRSIFRIVSFLMDKGANLAPPSCSSSVISLLFDHIYKVNDKSPNEIEFMKLINKDTLQAVFAKRFSVVWMWFSECIIFPIPLVVLLGLFWNLNFPRDKLYTWKLKKIMYNNNMYNNN